MAVTTATRSEALPEISTVSDFVPGFETSDWGGVSGPRGTPAEIIDRLNQGINAGLADPKIKARFADLGATVLPGNREVGQGGQVRGHQGGVIRISAAIP